MPLIFFVGRPQHSPSHSTATAEDDDDGLLNAPVFLLNLLPSDSYFSGFQSLSADEDGFFEK